MVLQVKKIEGPIDSIVVVEKEVHMSHIGCRTLDLCISIRITSCVLFKTPKSINCDLCDAQSLNLLSKLFLMEYIFT